MDPYLAWGWIWGLVGNGFLYCVVFAVLVVLLSYGGFGWVSTFFSFFFSLSLRHRVTFLWLLSLSHPRPSRSSLLAAFAVLSVAVADVTSWSEGLKWLRWWQTSVLSWLPLSILLISFSAFKGLKAGASKIGSKFVFS